MSILSRDIKAAILCALGVIFLFLVWAVTPPGSLRANSVVEVPEGKGLSALARDLEDRGVIRSPLLFRGFATLFGGERSMQAGQYFMRRPQNVILLAWRISRGEHGVEQVKITVPEGFTVKKISALFDQRFTFFDNNVFETTAPEGYLFPDTYFVPVTTTASSTVKLMYDNFIRKMFPVMPEVEDSGRTLEEIIIMASLLEGEVQTKLDREMVSDILWKRLKLDMPLQVDSYMWTYDFKGLPEKPINNPGLVAIKAAIHPTTTPYLYFLTGDDGKTYYAKTFDEHKTNIQKYLE